MQGVNSGEHAVVEFKSEFAVGDRVIAHMDGEEYAINEIFWDPMSRAWFYLIGPGVIVAAEWLDAVQGEDSDGG